MYIHVHTCICNMATISSPLTVMHIHPQAPQAHVCDAVQLDSGTVSSVQHWRAVAASVGWLTGRAADDRQEAMAGAW